jgi:hypothetical protein
MAKSGKRNTSKTTGSASSGTAVATAPRPGTTETSSNAVVTLAYEQIAQRAEEIWIKKGRLPGQDEQNWLEAERQLMAELARK